MATKYLNMMFTDAVSRAQKQYSEHADKITGASEQDPLGEAKAGFITTTDSFYIGTLSEPGWPYVSANDRGVVSFDWNCPKYITSRYSKEAIRQCDTWDQYS